MPAATGRRTTASGSRTCLPITSPSPVTTAKIRPAQVCPSGAMHKREDGFVVVNEEVCIGCRYCHMACPYGAPQYNADKGHMTKCDGCHERVAEGKKPICVESCPLRALDFGPIAELRAKHGQLAAVAPLPSAHFTRPSIVIKPNANARPWRYHRLPGEPEGGCEMGNGWHEWPLMVFTVFGQCVVGGLLFWRWRWMDRRFPVSRSSAWWQACSTVGTDGDRVYCLDDAPGSPLRAFNSLNRMGASSLSNEIASGRSSPSAELAGCWPCKSCLPFAEPVAGGDHGAGRDFRVDDGAGIQHHRHGADLVTPFGRR